MRISKVARAYEDVWLDDPAENPGTPHWRVPFDDESVEGYLAKVSSAIDRAQDNERRAEAATTPEERRAANEAQVRLIKRVVSAFIGTDGWDELLRWLGDGEPVDPASTSACLARSSPRSSTCWGATAPASSCAPAGCATSACRARPRRPGEARRRASDDRRLPLPPSAWSCPTAPWPCATRGAARPSWCGTGPSRPCAWSGPCRNVGAPEAERRDEFSWAPRPPTSPRHVRLSPGAGAARPARGPGPWDVPWRRPAGRPPLRGARLGPRGGRGAHQDVAPAGVPDLLGRGARQDLLRRSSSRSSADARRTRPSGEPSTTARSHEAEADQVQPERWRRGTALTGPTRSTAVAYAAPRRAPAPP